MNRLLGVQQGASRRSPGRWPAWLTRGVWVSLLVTCVLGGCQYPLDRLYALPLDHAPTERDWQEAVPLRRVAVGGRTTRPAEKDVDSDAVHTSTASCHHGVKEPPVAVELRAFHADGRLYVRVEWVDPTESRGYTWSWTEGGWQAAGGGEDGLGVLWGGGDVEGFSCVRYCHLEDWRRAGQRTLADYSMAVPDDSPPVDFWVWRAGRGSVAGSVEDSRLSGSGRKGDGAGPAESYRANSIQALQGGQRAFGDGDRPVESPGPAPGMQAPGYLWEAVPMGRQEVESTSRWRAGRWSVTLSRTFSGNDPDDIELKLGGDAVFGLAILDAVERDHLALAEPVRLHIVAPRELDLLHDRVRK